jgi:hypothetical protein
MPKQSRFLQNVFFSLKCFLTLFQGVWRLPKNRAGDLCQRRHSVKFIFKFDFTEKFYFGEINLLLKFVKINLEYFSFQIHWRRTDSFGARQSCELPKFCQEAFSKSSSQPLLPGNCEASSRHSRFKAEEHLST